MKIMTGYSFSHSVGHIEEVMDRLVECGYTSAPISDFCSTFGFARWRKLAKGKGLKPLYGVTIPVSSAPEDKKPPTAEFTFFAKEKLTGLHTLIETSSNQVRYTPLLTYSQVQEADDVMVIVGNRANLEALEPADNIYVGLSPAIYKGFYNAAKEKGFKFIATSENRYTNQGDRSLYETVMGDFKRSTQSYPQWILDEAEWLDAVAKTGATEAELQSALDNRRDFELQCTAPLPNGTLLTPPKPFTMRELCVQGAAKLGVDLSEPVYAARLDRELGLIDDKGFEDYFYIVSEMIAWAKTKMIVGPGRGSSSGSLVCYLLGITMIDPIPWALLFERFIDINRADLPDIDIDFSDQRRHLVFTHMEDLYGVERIARLGTVSRYKPRSALQEAGASLNVPFWKTNPVLDSLIETSSGDARALKAIEDTFSNTPAGQALISEFPEMVVAMRMEGLPKNKSKHAAGIIVTERPVKEYVAVDSQTGGTHCDKKDAEELNLLKIDALGLTQLAVFEDVLNAVGLPYSWLDTIPTDYQPAFDVLNDQKYSGIFQFEGAALQRIAREIDIQCLDDIVSLTALARPGPLSSGSTGHWIKRKNKKEEVKIPHELFEPYLLDTFGVVVYQEQIMSIVREVGGLSWEDTSNLRKAMSKSMGREFFDQFGNPFKDECVKKGVPFEVAFELWDALCAFGAWCFNKSHAVAYGLISYQCAYLKAKFPMEFAAATLTHKKEVADQLIMLREMSKENIEYIPVHVEHSTDKWRVATIGGRELIVGPVQNVVGIGPKTVQEIITCRAQNLPLPSRASKLLSAAKTKIDSLFPIRDGFNRVMPDPRERNILNRPTPIENIQIDGTDFDVLVFCTLAKINPKDENEDINVAKRGYAVRGPRHSLGLHLEDDSGSIYAKVGRYDFETLGKPLINRGRSGKALYAIKGSVPKDFRMINISMVRYIGDIDPKFEDASGASGTNNRTSVESYGEDNGGEQPELRSEESDTQGETPVVENTVTGSYF